MAQEFQVRSTIVSLNNSRPGAPRIEGHILFNTHINRPCYGIETVTWSYSRKKEPTLPEASRAILDYYHKAWADRITGEWGTLMGDLERAIIREKGES